MHVITRDRNAIELGHVRAGVRNNVRHDPHRWFGRINIGVTDHEFFQNVVLNCAVELCLGNALFLTRHNEKRKDRNHRAVHRHRYRHLVQRDAIEQNFHILDRIDGNASLANIADNARVVAVIATVRGEIEGDRKALLSGGQVAAVKGVRFFGSRETGILADGPWPTRIHRRTHTARKWRKAGKTRVASILCGI